MSIKVMSMVFQTKIPEIKYRAGIRTVSLPESTAKIVLLAIADSANDEGKESWNSVSTLARKTGLSERSIERITHALMDAGVLLYTGETEYGTNNWSINLDSLSDAFITKRARGNKGRHRDVKMASPLPKNGVNMTPNPYYKTSYIRPNQKNKKFTQEEYLAYAKSHPSASWKYLPESEMFQLQSPDANH